MNTLDDLIRDAILDGHEKFLGLPAVEQDRLIAAFVAERPQDARYALSEGLADDHCFDLLARRVLAFLAEASLSIAIDIAAVLLAETKARIALDLEAMFIDVKEAMCEPSFDGTDAPLASESDKAARAWAGDRLGLGE